MGQTIMKQEKGIGEVGGILKYPAWRFKKIFEKPGKTGIFHLIQLNSALLSYIRLNSVLFSLIKA